MILRQKGAGKGRENILGDLGFISVLRREKRNTLIFYSTLLICPFETHIPATLYFIHFTNILPPSDRMDPSFLCAPPAL